MQFRRYALVLAAALPAAACTDPPPGPPPGPPADNQVGTAGGPATDFTPNAELPAAGPAGNAVAPGEVASRDANYLGRWTGVEGMYLEVRPGTAPGRFELEMQYDLDHKQSAGAALDGKALVFDRNGARQTLRPTDGAATGLKYLAGKQDCLTVGAGEGYCRD